MPASRLFRFLAAALVLLAAAGCALNVIGRGDPGSVESLPGDRALVFGRINYVIDGRIKTPYGAFRPAWPAPPLTLLSLESGEFHSSPAVADADGSFVWELPPGHYVISRIGVGQIWDDTYIAWPRIAFRVPSGPRMTYLGHLVLDGSSYTEEFTYSTGRKSTTSGVRYRFEVRDEMESQLAGLRERHPGKAMPAGKALMFHDPQMPIGEPLANAWRASREAVIARIFGAAQQ
ncbi:MAG TPA: hypothetical protein VF104_01785 [Burkholderiales bacterium]